MASKSDYCEIAVLDHLFNDPALTAPAIYMALCTTIPTDASLGTNIVEATYTGYARKQVATTDMGAAAAGAKTNSAAITFAACTAGSSTIVGFALCDASGTGAGNIIYWGTTTSKVIDVNNTPPTIAIGGLSISED